MSLGERRFDRHFSYRRRPLGPGKKPGKGSRRKSRLAPTRLKETKRCRTVHRHPSASQKGHARLHGACPFFYPVSIALLSREHFIPSSSQDWTPSTQLAAWSRKSSEHFASHASTSSAGAAKLDIIRGHRVAPHLCAEEAAARLEEHGQSMRANA